jgi:hypothetical protein
VSNNIELFPQEGADSARITITDEYTMVNGKHFRIVDGYVHRQSKAVSVKTKDILSVERDTLRFKKMLVSGLVLFGLLVLVFQGVQYINGVLAAKRAVDTAVAHANEFLSKNPYELLDEMFGDDVNEWMEGVKTAVVVTMFEIASRQVLGDDFTNMAVKGFYAYKEIEGLPDRLAEEFQNQIENSVFSSIEDINRAAGFDIFAAYDEAQERFEQANRIASGDFGLGALNVLLIVLCLGLLGGSVVCIGKYAVSPLYVLQISAIGGDFAVEVKNYDSSQVNKLINKYYRRG